MEKLTRRAFIRGTLTTLVISQTPKIKNYDKNLKQKIDYAFERGVFAVYIEKAKPVSWTFIPLKIITQINGEQNYYLGINFHKPLNNIDATKFEKLKQPIPLNLYQSIWLGPDNKIYLGNKKDKKPIAFPQKHSLLFADS